MGLRRLGRTALGTALLGVLLAACGDDAEDMAGRARSARAAEAAIRAEERSCRSELRSLQGQVPHLSRDVELARVALSDAEESHRATPTPDLQNDVARARSRLAELEATQARIGREAEATEQRCAELAKRHAPGR